ncbi:hypothetical protein BBF96_10940 [Anoxybacter fermentans]|uniref:Pilus assembly protein PilZ n=1 Tax=Anoxybacter fermentans TaxID=1323375 RepID=A0A3Q9HRK9_9FIRM|nr:flagellar brake domain-containing protein [Anoxybacter fermentans]AZR73857.1 hypothetical protein BBF96_10940 [Anoxybacter fermentans]
MVALSELTINTKIEIEVEDPNFEGKYFSRVMDINDKELHIMAPAVNGELIPFRLNTPIIVTYVGERALYSFKSIILRRFKEPIPGFALRLPAEVKRIQRREFVRLEINIPLYYRLIDESEKIPLESDSSGSRQYIKTYTLDISGGGVRFYSDEIMEVNSNLEIKLGLKGIEEEVIFGKIVRNQEKEEGGYEVGVAFESISSSVQDRIIGWIFDKQRELIRKGLA